MSSFKISLALFFICHAVFVLINGDTPCFDPKEGFSNCSSRCDESCTSNPPCTAPCEAGCFCQAGYKRSSSNVCVLENACSVVTTTTSSTTTSTTPSTTASTSSSTTPSTTASTTPSTTASTQSSTTTVSTTSSTASTPSSTSTISTTTTPKCPEKYEWRLGNYCLETCLDPTFCETTLTTNCYCISRLWDPYTEDCVTSC